MSHSEKEGERKKKTTPKETKRTGNSSKTKAKAVVEKPKKATKPIKKKKTEKVKKTAVKKEPIVKDCAWGYSMKEVVSKAANLDPVTMTWSDNPTPVVPGFEATPLRIQRERANEANADIVDQSLADYAQVMVDALRITEGTITEMRKELSRLRARLDYMEATVTPKERRTRPLDSEEEEEDDDSAFVKCRVCGCSKPQSAFVRASYFKRIDSDDGSQKRYRDKRIMCKECYDDPNAQ